MADRRRDILVFVFAFVGLVAAGLIQVSAGSALWEAKEGLIFSTMEMAATILPGNRDVPVSILTGTISGLLLLFLADCTKRLQLLAVIVVSIFIGVFLNVNDNVVSAVMSEPLFYLLPLILTAVILPIVTQIRVSGPPTVTDIDRRIQLLRFPAATTILYLILVSLVGLVTIQYPLIRPETDSQLLPFESLPTI
jgi:hypothetical protein